MDRRITTTLARLTIASLFASMGTLALAAGCAGEGDENSTNGGDTTTNTTSGGDGGFDGSTGGAGGDPGSGGEGPGSYTCGEGSSKAELNKLPADLIVVVDNSNSMALEAAQVKAHIATMVGAISATNIDAHVIVISKESNNTIFDVLETGVCVPAPVGSGNCPNDENLPGYRHVVQEVGSNDPLEQVIATYDDWKGSLRPNATKTFLVVSDDESDMTAAAFNTALGQLSPPIADYKFNAIVASEGPLSCAVCAVMGCGNCANPCCDKTLSCLPVSMDKGSTYMDLQTQSTGVYGDLCTQNFAPVFTDMATAVIEHNQIACDFDIPVPPAEIVLADQTNVDFYPAPSAQAQRVGNVGGAQDCTINGGWYFNSASNPTKIILCPSTCTLVKESTEGEMQVEYGCETQTNPN